MIDHANLKETSVHADYSIDNFFKETFDESGLICFTSFSFCVYRDGVKASKKSQPATCSYPATVSILLRDRYIG